MNTEKTIRVSLPSNLFEALRDSAIQECRHPKDHARYILQNALFGNSKTADTTCEVSQAKQVSSGFAGVVNS